MWVSRWNAWPPGGWSWLEASACGLHVGPFGLLTAWGLGARVGVLKESQLGAVTFCDPPHGPCIVRHAAVAVPPRLEVQACRPCLSLSGVSLPAGEGCSDGAAAVASLEAATPSPVLRHLELLQCIHGLCNAKQA